MIHLHAAATRADEPQSVIARSGATIDTSTDKWMLSADETLYWSHMAILPEHLLAATREYMRHLVRTASPDYVRSQFHFLLKAFGAIRDLLAPLRPNDDLGFAEFSEAKRRLAGEVAETAVRDHLGSYRRWYVWSSDAGFDGFDEDVATGLEELRIGRSIGGAAVLRHDPHHGPLNDVEFTGLAAKLRSGAADALPLAHRVAAWLCIAFGTNGKNLRLLREEDMVKTALNDGTAVYELRIPRIKKRNAGERDAFTTRSLDGRIGALVEDLIAENAAKRAQDPDWDDARHHRSLFSRHTMSDRLAGTQFGRDAYRVSRRWIHFALRRVSDALGLNAFPSGERLHLTPRRLRYTFATRLVLAGASPVDVAEALDHTDTSYVLVYFNARSDIVPRLDEKLAVRLAPRAQAFLGTLVRSEAEAKRGNDPASRVRRFDRKACGLEAVGTCGSFGFCGLYAPIACYTCVLFQPWLDGPHGAVLAELLLARDRNLERGASPRITRMHDLTIYAVAEVVRRCEEVKGGLGPGGSP